MSSAGEKTFPSSSTSAPRAAAAEAPPLFEHDNDEFVVLRMYGNTVKILVRAAQIVSWKNNSGDELVFYGKAEKPAGLHLGGIRICCPTGRDVRIEGLDEKDCLDKVQQKKFKSPKKGTTQEPPTFESEYDREFYKTHEAGAEEDILFILDHGYPKRRNYVLRKDKGLPDAVVWNPWETEKTWKSNAETFSGLKEKEYQNFVCVGAAIVENPVKLNPGGIWTGCMTLSVENMGYPLLKKETKKQVKRRGAA